MTELNSHIVTDERAGSGGERGMKSNGVVYATRPPANNKNARRAWDSFVSAVGKELPGSPAQGRAPKNRSYRFMDYWCWVMEFANGEFDEIDALENY
jgi:hypothetical protein